MSIRRTTIDRVNEARKSSVPTIGKGKPLDATGSEGDIAFRRTSEGLKLYIKANHKWHGTKVGESFNSLEQKVNEIKSKVDTIKQFKLPSTYSVTGDFILDASGDITLNADGGQVAIKDDTATHFKLDCDNTRFVMYDDQDEADLFSIQIAEHGATTISTVDDGADIAHLTLDADGVIKLDAVASLSSTGIKLLNSGTEFANFNVHHSATYFRMYENGGASTDDYADIRVYAHGEMRIVTQDTFAAEADIKLLPDGDIILEPVAGGPKIKESADAAADSVGYGQIWVHDTTPNELCFTVDAGTDIIGIGKYQYDMQVTNFYASVTTNYVPLPGYVIERTSLTSQNDFVCMVAPYNGTIEKIVFRSEAAHNGNLVFTVTKSSDGTEIPTTISGIHSTSINIADDTTQHIDFTTGFSLGGNSIVKGDIFAISCTTPSSPNDTNITVVLKWDITS